MSKFQKFNFGNKNEFLEKIDELGLEIGWSNDIDVLFEGLSFKSDKKIHNRFAIHPMEGCDAEKDGKPGKLTERRYLKFARGGAGLIWWEATSVVPEGRSNPRQLLLNKDNLDEFSALIDKINNEAIKENEYRPINLLQLNHSGRYSSPRGKKQPIYLFNDPYTDKIANITEDHNVVEDDYLKELEEKYFKAARFAKKAGFDGVDIKACHRYLLSEMLAAHTRNGEFGGNYHNRVKLIMNIIERIETFIDDLIIAVRINAYDCIPYPYGWGMKKEGLKKDLTEPIKLVKELAKSGVEIFSITASDPRIKPHIVRPFNRPVKEGEIPSEHPLEGCARLYNLTEKIQKEIPEKIVLGAGYSWLRQFFPYAAASNIINKRAKMVGLGRMAFAYPHFVNDLKFNNRLNKNRVCVACSKCTELMKKGGPTGCVVRDNKYLNIYKKTVKG